MIVISPDLRRLPAVREPSLLAGASDLPVRCRRATPFFRLEIPTVCAFATNIQARALGKQP